MRRVCPIFVGNPRKDDESVQTSLRALMEQEEERVRAEKERLEQLRAAKIRIDHERAEAAREEEEQRALERETAKAAAVERVRIESLAKVEAERRAEERVAIEKAIAPPPRPKPSRLGVGFVLGIAFTACAAAASWFAFGAPRIARAATNATSAWGEVERERTRAHAAESARDDANKETDALRAENDALRRALLDARSPCRVAPTAPTSAPHAATRSRCNPHDPLCGDL
jgi:hypothetical protein